MAQSAIAFGASMKVLSGAPLALGPNDERLRDQVIEVAAQLHERGALLGGAANASVLLADAPGRILITSRGLPRDLGPDDFGVVTLGGEFVSGQLGKGIRSVIGMHTHAYRRPGVGAAFHAHSPFATVFAVAHRPIPANFYEPLINRGQKVEIPVTDFGERDSGQMVDQLDRLLERHADTRAVLLANHGVLVFHDDVKQAADLLAAVNDAAALCLRAETLGGARPLIT